MQTLLVKGVGTCLIALHDTENLYILGEKAWRQKAMDAQLEPFLQSKPHALQAQNHRTMNHTTKYAASGQTPIP